MAQNEMKAKGGLPERVLSNEGLGVGGVTNERMPHSSRSPDGRATKVLRAAADFLARKGCGPTD